MPSNIGEVILTGMGMGVVHVLSGPDHLSALATLSASTSYKSFILGVRWGLGHSTGLLLVALILLLGDSEFKINDGVTRTLDEVVGVFMITLGLYGMVQTFRHEFNSGGTSDIKDVILTDDDFDAEVDDDLEMCDLLKDEPKSDDKAFEGDFGGENFDFDGESYGGKEGDAEVLQSLHSHPHDHGSSLLLWCSMKGCYDSTQNPIFGKFVAFGVGVVHGIAGPGGILGVIPAIHMGGFLAFVYLGSFCGMSIIVMAIFAGTYGELSGRLANTRKLKIGINLFSALTSIVVGVLWCVLSYLGVLNEYFD